MIFWAILAGTQTLTMGLTRGAWPFACWSIVLVALASSLVPAAMVAPRRFRLAAGEDIRTVEALDIRWKRVAILSPVLAPVGAVAFTDLLMFWATRQVLLGWGTLFLMAGFAVFFLPFTFTISLALALRTRVLPLKTRPNQGIHLTARKMLVAGIAVASPTLLVLSLFRFAIQRYSSVFSSSAPNALGFTSGLVFLIFFVLIFGGFDLIGHYSLRLVLALRGDLPFRAVRFLDQAADQIFLRKVGGGYIFIHRVVLDYFARDAAERLLRGGPRATAAQLRSHRS